VASTWNGMHAIKSRVNQPRTYLRTAMIKHGSQQHRHRYAVPRPSVRMAVAYLAPTTDGFMSSTPSTCSAMQRGQWALGTECSGRKGTVCAVAVDHDARSEVECDGGDEPEVEGELGVDERQRTMRAGPREQQRRTHRRDQREHESRCAGQALAWSGSNTRGERRHAASGPYDEGSTSGHRAGGPRGHGLWSCRCALEAR
jgi:hypothetical protein